MLRWPQRASAAVLTIVFARASVAIAAEPPVAAESPVAAEPADDVVSAEPAAEVSPEVDAPSAERTPDPPTVAPDASHGDSTSPPDISEPGDDDEPVEAFAPRGTRIDLVGGAPGELELFHVDPEAGARSVGTFEGLPFVRVCAAPCTAPVRIHEGEYFVAGPKVMPSRAFTLDAHVHRPELRLHVRPGPRAIRFAGFGLIVSGAILVPGGGLLVGAVDRGRASDIAGYVLIGTGVAALAAGIALVIRGRTLVRVPDGVASRR